MRKPTCFIELMQQTDTLYSPGANPPSGYMRLHEISDYLEQSYKADCVIIQNGAFYDAYKASAQYLNANFDYVLYEDLNKDQSGQTVCKAGFPVEYGYEHLKTTSDRLIVVAQTAEHGNRGTLVREIVDAVNIGNEIVGQRFNAKSVPSKTTRSRCREPESSETEDSAVSEPSDDLDTYEITAYYFLKGLTIREIAKERGQSAMTIQKHFCICAQRNLLAVSDVFPNEDTYQRLQERITAHPEWKAKRLFEELDDGRMQYFQIYYAMGKFSGTGNGKNPTVKKQVLVLANSSKSPGRCVAGIEIVSDDPEGLHFGGFIRPIDATQPEGALRVPTTEIEGRAVQPLDIVEVEFRKCAEDPNHPEDWIIYQGSDWVYRGRLCRDRLNELPYGTEDAWGSSKRIEPGTAKATVQVIQVKHRLSASAYITTRYGFPKYEVRLYFNGHDISITDTQYIETQGLHDLAQGQTKTVEIEAGTYLVLSLTPPFEPNNCGTKYQYRVVAAII